MNLGVTHNCGQFQWLYIFNLSVFKTNFFIIFYYNIWKGRGQRRQFSASASLWGKKALQPMSQSTCFVVWGQNLQSTVKDRFSRKELAMVKLSPYQFSVIIVLLLSDGWLTLPLKTQKNARLGFSQSLAHYEYVWFVFNLLSHYCSSSPKLTTGIKWGKRYWALQFFTRSMPCLTELYYEFYSSGVKRIPNNVYELLTPVALAHVIMGDGSVLRSGLIICTDSYSIEEVVRLINVLIIRYRLECTIRVHRKNQYRIYIRQNSIASLLSIVSPYMHLSMLYKVNTLNATEA